MHIYVHVVHALVCTRWGWASHLPLHSGRGPTKENAVHFAPATIRAYGRVAMNLQTEINTITT